MRFIICGANGTMGKLLQTRLAGEISGLVSLHGENGAAKTFRELKNAKADAIIDFSHRSAIGDVLDYAKTVHCAAVIGTTGHSEAEVSQIHTASRDIPIFYSGNMSFGIAILCQLAQQAAEGFPGADIEILEIHHNRKSDAPSGTAYMLYNAIKEVRPCAKACCNRYGEGKRLQDEIGISSLRMGNVAGIHEVHICSPSQTLTLRHEAHDRSMYADGAIQAARYICGKPPGLYTMSHLLAQL